jgi:hypothetical protein
MNSELSRRVIACIFACGLIMPAHAEDSILADRAAVQAAFLYNFGLFTEWPGLPDNEFKICVIADDKILDALAEIKNKRIKDHTLSINKIDSAKLAVQCQILFVGVSAQASMKEMAGQIGLAPVLVIAEEGSYDLGDVIIALNEKQNRIGFKINRTEAAKRSLTFSSKLLRLATQVY